MIDPEFQSSFDQAIGNYAQKNTFGVSLIPAHTHNGTDSLNVNFSDIQNKQATGSVTIQGNSASIASNYSVFFIAPYIMRVIAISEVHTTAGSDAGAVTLNVEKLTGTQAPGAGINLLTTAFNLKGTANTVQTGSLVGAVSGVDQRNLATNNRLALVLSGTPTAVTNVTVSLVLGF